MLLHLTLLLYPAPQFLLCLKPETYPQVELTTTVIGRLLSAFPPEERSSSEERRWLHAATQRSANR